MNTTHKKAFTLVEVMIVTLISTAVFAGIYSTFIVGNRAWVYYNDSVAAKKEARRALFGMVKELREAQDIKVVQRAGACALHFHRPSVGAVSYIWGTRGDQANRIIRRDRSGMRILAQHITALSFEQTDKAVMVNISAGKKSSQQELVQVALREKVALRSKTVMFK